MSPVEAWNSAFLSSCEGGVRPPVEFMRGLWAFSTGAKGEGDLPSCWEGIPRVPFKSVQANQALSQVEGELGVLSLCSKDCEVLSVSLGESDLLL